MHKAQKRALPLKKNLLGLISYGLLLFLCSLVYMFFVQDIAQYVAFVRRLLIVGAGVLLALFLMGLRFSQHALCRVGKRLLTVLWALVLTFVLLMGILAGAGHFMERPAEFEVTTPFFSDKTVLVFVPHQDDEVNLAGGILEQYTACGSQVYVAFSTNGDYYASAQTRMKEALAASAEMGIPEKNVFFLGFGDQWQSQQQDGSTIEHIYNCTLEDQLWTSASGNTHSYGTDLHAPYQSVPYTRAAYLASIQSLIEENRPDVIYCVDYDSHIDHKALDLFFEEALGNVLAENPDYTPTVYKGFCYGTAWEAEDDFCAADGNFLSTKKPNERIWEASASAYSWEDRVRLPMAADNLYRTLTKNTVYQTLARHSSQNAYFHSTRILNSDKVFWQRRTDSLLYDAQFLGDGVSQSLWNDFKYRDSQDLSDPGFPGSSAKSASCIEVLLPQPRNIHTIALYDSPNADANILKGCILLEDGSRIEFGPLNKNGSATLVQIPEQELSRFSVCITEAEGENPGLSEIEAYGSSGAHSPSFIVPIDEMGNFVTDYWIDSKTAAIFNLYAYPGNGTIDWDDVEITVVSDADFSWEISEGSLHLDCPKGEKAVITASYGEQVSVTFSVSNPGHFARTCTASLQWVNQHAVYTWEGIVYLARLILSKIL